MNPTTTRRHFLKTAAGAGLALPSALAAQQAAAPAPKPAFETRALGKTGIRLPILSMGVMRADNPGVVRAALKSGIVHLDTAHVYQHGRNEQMLGKVLKGTPRDAFVIATKVKPSNRPDNPDNPRLLLEKFNTSMERLGLEYVDILYLHAIGDPAFVTNRAIMDALLSIQKSGRARHLGVSTHQNEVAVIDAVIAAQIYGVVLTAYNFRKASGPAGDIRAAVARAAKAGLGVVAMKTMAGAKDVNIPAALKWALRDRNVTTAIPGFTNFEELDVCLKAAANLEYTAEEKAFLAGADGIGTLYCQQCRRCDGQCPRDLPIPDLMRAYMYAHGYRQPAKARETLDELALAENTAALCASCGDCSVRCAIGFDVAAKVRDIARLRDVPEAFLV
ncbi:MAG: aldo/keto reductase [Opitutaceae bacterium]|jgi:predicted aldo/keto reductase-like oxidoreductase|nr:aldo/keto reductase [Opitutaceae bacterium]